MKGKSYLQPNRTNLSNRRRARKRERYWQFSKKRTGEIENYWGIALPEVRFRILAYALKIKLEIEVSRIPWKIQKKKRNSQSNPDPCPFSGQKSYNSINILRLISTLKELIPNE